MTAPADTRTVTIQLSELTEYLGCVLCHGMLRDAHTIPECLHSFCKSCIYRHFLVQGSRSCPKCFISLKPRPHTLLISDQKLQDVVDRIFPEFKADDERLEEEFYREHEFAKKEGDSAKAASAKRSSARSNQSGRSRKSSQGLPLESGPRVVMSFQVEVLPMENESRPLPMLPLRHLYVDGRFKVFDLLKWVRAQLEVSDGAELEITCMGATVGPELSMHFIHRTIWQHQHDEEQRLVLHYRMLIP
ncbi:hypothetical protein P43SY_001904 [Pythium insidiosum]|uniref:RING-type domain-containing protein n=1 Tax=Pythium insidiosum TaxID=114742 RepID=A0AAD5LFG2_PYTIN|nr:hypothetical protein P43SY_001904 [Pythium insidiosum]KAJ0396398.1 hypothetical protein ATCC90586_005267 [Pythium insidiosum]